MGPSGGVGDAACRRIARRHANIPGQDMLPGVDWPEPLTEEEGEDDTGADFAD